MIRSPQTPREWEHYYQLRYDILRAPWGQPIGSEQTADEKVHQHFSYFDNSNQILGVGRLDSIDSQTTQIRFMAVAEQQQGKGIGRALMEEMENVSKEMGIQKIVLHARATALPFNEKLGYQLDAPSHLLFGEIQHFLMHKLI